MTDPFVPSTGPALGLNQFRMYDEFESSSAAANRYWLDWTIAVAGAAAAVVSIPGEPRHPGIIQLQTGTTATGAAEIRQSLAARRLGGGMRTK